LSVEIKQQPENNLTSTEMRHQEYRIMFEAEDNFWWYVGMRNNLKTILQRYWDWKDKPNPLIVDAGCGTGAVLQRLVNGFDGSISPQNAIGFDLSDEALRFCAERGLGDRVSRGSITEMPFADNTFDILVSFDVISNLPEPTPGFKEVARVVKHGGMLVLNLPAYQFLYSEHDLAVRTLRRFDKKEVRSLLAQNGLMPLHMTYLNTVLFPPAAGVRLTKKMFLKAKPGKELHSDLTPPPTALNNLLVWTMAQEANLIGRSSLSLPFGLSLMTIARKM
jgi:SAM-dependent methyltransferase